MNTRQITKKDLIRAYRDAKPSLFTLRVNKDPISMALRKIIKKPAVRMLSKGSVLPANICVKINKIISTYQTELLAKKSKYQTVLDLHQDLPLIDANQTMQTPVTASSTSTSTSLVLNKLCHEATLPPDMIAYILSYFANDLPRLRELRFVSERWREIIDDYFRKIGPFNYTQVKQVRAIEPGGLHFLKESFSSIALSQDGKTLAVIKRKIFEKSAPLIKLFDMASFTEIVSYTAPCTGFINGLIFSNDNNYLIFKQRDSGTLYVLDRKNNSFRHYINMLARAGYSDQEKYIVPYAQSQLIIARGRSDDLSSLIILDLEQNDFNSIVTNLTITDVMLTKKGDLIAYHLPQPNDANLIFWIKINLPIAFYRHDFRSTITTSVLPLSFKRNSIFTRHLVDDKWIILHYASQDKFEVIKYLITEEGIALRPIPVNFDDMIPKLSVSLIHSFIVLDHIYLITAGNYIYVTNKFMTGENTPLTLMKMFALQSVYQPYCPSLWTTLCDPRTAVIVMNLLGNILSIHFDRYPIRHKTNDNAHTIETYEVSDLETDATPIVEPNYPTRRP